MPDRVEFRFAILYEARGVSGQFVDHCREYVFADIPTAREQHWQACKGGWVEHGMIRPTVSALRVWKNGRILAEELRPAADLPEFAETSPREGIDPRRIPQPADA